MSELWPKAEVSGMELVPTRGPGIFTWREKPSSRKNNTRARPGSPGGPDLCPLQKQGVQEPAQDAAEAQPGHLVRRHQVDGIHLLAVHQHL